MDLGQESDPRADALQRLYDRAQKAPLAQQAPAVEALHTLVAHGVAHPERRALVRQVLTACAASEGAEIMVGSGTTGGVRVNFYDQTSSGACQPLLDDFGTAFDVSVQARVTGLNQTQGGSLAD